MKFNVRSIIGTYQLIDFFLYHTFKDILYGKDDSISIKNIEKKGEKFNPKKHFLGTSLLRPIDPKERFCDNYIDIGDCICKVKK